MAGALEEVVRTSCDGHTGWSYLVCFSHGTRFEFRKHVFSDDLIGGRVIREHVCSKRFWKISLL